VSILLRVGLLIVSLLVAVGIAATSAQGGALIEFSKGSRAELRKMVWPSRQETMQTTWWLLLRSSYGWSIWRCLRLSSTFFWV